MQVNGEIVLGLSDQVKKVKIQKSQSIMIRFVQKLWMFLDCLWRKLLLFRPPLICAEHCSSIAASFCGLLCRFEPLLWRKRSLYPSEPSLVQWSLQTSDRVLGSGCLVWTQKPFLLPHSRYCCHIEWQQGPSRISRVLCFSNKRNWGYWIGLSTALVNFWTCSSHNAGGERVGES